MRFAFMPILSEQVPSWPSLLEMWQAADETDFFESGWVFDHFSATAVDAAGPCYEAWTILSALAQATHRLRLGTMVLSVARRHPALLAQMTLTLDTISAGRIELGLGAGWREADHRPHGISMGAPPIRADRLEEGCAALIPLLSGGRLSAHGHHFAMDEAECDIPPVQQPHPPICIGGKGELRTLRIAARWAQHWNYPGECAAEFSRKRALLHRYCTRLARDPAAITTSATVLAERSTPETTIRKVSQLAAAGADLVILRLRPPYGTAAVESLITTLSSLGRN
ncbi:LLM class flavin-dependent oxidoreductase [Nonomuraea sp. NPDC051941]|uniref:LLM class flavin-dependent oxidoreductase n=1 Tax=Nonomuraea sp. NPDC051941 TaxID=3364373 RepID=UPI0037CA69FC